MDVAITRPAVPRQRWRAFYAVVGVISTLFGALNLAGPLEGLMRGCSVHFGQGDDALGPGRPGCASYVDVPTVVIVVIAVLAGIVLIVAAVRYRDSDRVSTAITAGAIVIAVLVSALPLISVWWLVGYYRLGVGPMEFGVALTVLGVALVVGWRTARYILERRASELHARRE